MRTGGGTGGAGVAAVDDGRRGRPGEGRGCGAGRRVSLMSRCSLACPARPSSFRVVVLVDAGLAIRVGLAGRQRTAPSRFDLCIRRGGNREQVVDVPRVVR